MCFSSKLFTWCVNVLLPHLIMLHPIHQIHAGRPLRKAMDRCNVKEKTGKHALTQAEFISACVLMPVSVSAVISFYCSFSEMGNWGLYQCRGQMLLVSWVCPFSGTSVRERLKAGACFKGLFLITVIGFGLVFRSIRTLLFYLSKQYWHFDVIRNEQTCWLHNNQDPDI